MFYFIMEFLNMQEKYGGNIRRKDWSESERKMEKASGMKQNPPKEKDRTPMALPCSFYASLPECE